MEERPDTPESLAADLERWAAGRLSDAEDRRAAADFARRARLLAFSVPEVAVVGPDGKQAATGFYFEMPARQAYPLGGAPEEIPVRRGLAGYDPGDWGMPNTPRMAEVTPPHRFVPTGRFVSLLDLPGPGVSGGGK